MRPIKKTEPTSTPEYTLPGVLQFLQTEWRRFEREKNEWEIERAALKARIVFLEGERGGIETIKTDLMRRVKMLEYSLRKERNKYLELASTKKSPIEQLHRSDTENTSSDPTALSKTRSQVLNGDSKASLTQSYSLPSLYSHFNTANSVKSRVKSREILKSCLKEVENLPDIPPSKPVSELSEENDENQTTMISRNPGGQPPIYVKRKEMSQEEKDIQMKKAMKLLGLTLDFTEKVTSANDNVQATSVSSDGQVASVDSDDQATSVNGDDQVTSVNGDDQATSVNSDDQVNLRPKDPDADEKKKRRITVLAPPTYDGDPIDTLEKRDKGDDHGIQTREKLANRESKDEDADNKEEEEEQLMRDIQSQYNISSEQLTTMMQKHDSKSKAEGAETQDELNSLAWSLDDNEAGASTTESNTEPKQLDERLWKLQLALRSHLDTVRTVSFHSTRPVMASGSEDGVVKLWRIHKNTGKKSQECEPFINFRGHTAAVTSVLFIPDQERCFSSSLDSTIRVWNLPSPDRDLYDANYDATCHNTCIEHTDAVWDMKLLPKRDGDQFIASASADGTVRLWDTECRADDVKPPIGYDGAITRGELDKMDKCSPNPTSIEFSHSEPGKIMVAYQNSIIRLFDLATGQPVLNFNSDTTYDSTNATQINQIVAHPTLPLVISAHEDRYIRFFDINTGQCVHSMIAHLDSVSTLDINHTGLQLVSGGHDSSIRVWDTTMYTCLQEFSSHRRKSDEGVCSIRYHPSLPWLASGGADSIVRIYGPPS
ncbi:1,2-dihydroxy-3-keto-5-methylthiopentene dioxygenase [Basidiobolus ranarum]|uniref:1,2-dihydroxy-3-keto-5-methylthiopentene dioxygenase n=1 Tax=Basidiobolus ranarum TaxID=34480 RepID=A0ABR2VRW3_9FUNG